MLIFPLSIMVTFRLLFISWRNNEGEKTTAKTTQFRPEKRKKTKALRMHAFCESAKLDMFAINSITY